MHGDLDDLGFAYSNEVNSSSSTAHEPRPGSCSAIVKVLDDMEDLLIGHNTWTSYFNMLRIFKRYSFNYRLSSVDSTVIPGHTQVFPSYPGRLYSGDDFYLISSGLVSLYGGALPLISVLIRG